MISCVVAVEKNQGIGFNGQMPWPHLKGDMSWFKRLTVNQIVIMGSTTWKGLGKFLPDRINIVMSTSPHNYGHHTFSNPDDALNFCDVEYPDKEIFIIGGSAIYNQYMSVIDKFYITEIDAEYQCDRFFNVDYVRKSFTTVKEHVTITDPVRYTIKEYTI